jgi:xylan 1,4-beta-xylosidase
MRQYLFLFNLLWFLSTSTFAQTTQVQVGFAEKQGPMRMERMALGQGGLSEEPMLAGRLTELRALQPGIIRLFVSEYYDLLPKKGTYHFKTLDSMVTSVLLTGAKPLMSLCFKPKLLFPKIDQDIVEPNDYKQWEDLVYALVKHYKDRGAGIRYWEVGNEVDFGEIGGTPYRFKPDSYARYYKHTVAAVLRADPTALVGGPALADHRSPILPALLDACSEQKLPLHFVSWHHYNNSPLVIRKQIEYVKDMLKKHPNLHPETIMDEWNMDLFNPPLDPRFQPCYVAETIWQMKDAGLDWSCYYQIRDWYVSYETFEKVFTPSGAAFMTRWWNRQAQFSGLIDYQNQLRPAYYTFKLLSRMAGEKLKVTSTHDKVHGFATHDAKLEMHNMMLWNFSDQPVDVELSLNDLPKKMRTRHIVLDATGAGLDENQRLRPDPFVNIEQGNQKITVKLEPWAVHYWSLE